MTGHIPNFPPSQKRNEVQIVLPKHWDALPNSGNHHHQIRPKSQNSSNMPAGRYLSPQHSSVSLNRLSEPSLSLGSVAMKSNYNPFRLVWNAKGYCCLCVLKVGRRAWDQINGGGGHKKDVPFFFLLHIWKISQIPQQSMLQDNCHIQLILFGPIKRRENHCLAMLCLELL